MNAVLFFRHPHVQASLKCGDTFPLDWLGVELRNPVSGRHLDEERAGKSMPGHQSKPVQRKRVPEINAESGFLVQIKTRPVDRPAF